MHAVRRVDRRDFLASCGAASGVFTPVGNQSPSPLVISVRLLLDLGAHSGKGLGDAELLAFKRHQEKANREFGNSGIQFDLRLVEGAFLRKQGYSEIPDKFLARNSINLFVTDTLGYDIDRDRTGGCSIGPRPRGPQWAGDPYYKTFLGLSQAGETTLVHEYAHHLTLDTAKRPTASGNLWADFRNDYWLWRQRQGAAIPGFRACANSQFVISRGASHT